MSTVFPEGRKVVDININRPSMKVVRITNNQQQSVRVEYRETDTTVEIEIYPRVNILDNGKPKGIVLPPGKTMEISE